MHWPLAILCGFAALPAVAGDLAVRVTGAEPGKGQVLATLFGSRDHWMREPLIDTSAPVDGGGSTVIRFPDLPAGQYGVSIVYDENTNGELDTNLIGIPSEAFGFSNDASALFGPPDWENAAFPVGESDTSITIRLNTAE